VRVRPDARALLRRDSSPRVRIKVCCIASPHEATLALRAGADALGLVSAMPSGPGIVSDDTIDTVIAAVAGRAATVLLTSRQDAAGIAAQLQRARPSIVQIVDALPAAEYGVLRRSQPAVALMQVIHVRDASAVEEALSVAPHVDAILLDSGNPTATVKELGGTGRVHDWTISRAVQDAVDVPVFLAGGLRASNVAEAISTVQPFGVDVCSGVRVRGALDPDALRAFIDAVRGAT
jgi:phosphoribosylanthranilate isomerase